MDQAEIAERLARLHSVIDGTRRRDRLLLLAAGGSAAFAAWLAAADGVWILACGLGGLVAAAAPLSLRRLRAQRQRAALERAYPEQVALAMDRYRLACATARAERWKLFR
ncbi:hypothetical protein [Rhodobacter sp. NSM]|uniref:hypothetical protein n=1 Tax=Rhodobacter sp. NSM TaxID=3457501 RepID=UPI003FD43090